MLPDRTSNFRKVILKLKEQSNGYKSWGNVKLIEAAIRLEGNQCYLVHLQSPILDISFEELDLQNERDMLYARIFKKRSKVNVVLLTEQTNASKVKVEIPPILDDQAQLLGPSLRYVDHSPYGKNVVKALRGRYATNLSNGRTLCIGKNMEEAYIAAQLVEKTSKAWLGAAKIGGAKSINRFEAWAMHKFYMMKYSKESEKNR